MELQVVQAQEENEAKHAREVLQQVHEELASVSEKKAEVERSLFANAKVEQMKVQEEVMQQALDQRKRVKQERDVVTAAKAEERVKAQKVAADADRGVDKAARQNKMLMGFAKEKVQREMKEQVEEATEGYARAVETARKQETDEHEALVKDLAEYSKAQKEAKMNIRAARTETTKTLKDSLPASQQQVNYAQDKAQAYENMHFETGMTERQYRVGQARDSEKEALRVASDKMKEAHANADKSMTDEHAKLEKTIKEWMK